ncbi:type III secretion HpaP family protein [Bremerella sp. JC770]|uniref:type III secretion HpaP family protein n=1 Tax=Bremerella sp. JC770 TaxID=3232137 RepID=UPI003458D2C2
MSTERHISWKSKSDLTSELSSPLIPRAELPNDLQEQVTLFDVSLSDNDSLGKKPKSLYESTSTPTTLALPDESANTSHFLPEQFPEQGLDAQQQPVDVATSPLQNQGKTPQGTFGSNDQDTSPVNPFPGESEQQTFLDMPGSEMSQWIQKPVSKVPAEPKKLASKESEPTKSATKVSASVPNTSSLSYAKAKSRPDVFGEASTLVAGPHKSTNTNTNGQGFNITPVSSEHDANLGAEADTQSGSHDQHESKSDPFLTLGDTILNGIHSSNRSNAGPKDSLSTSQLTKFVNQVAESVLTVEKGGPLGSHEVRIQIKDSILPDTEVILRNEGASLVVHFATRSIQSAEILGVNLQMIKEQLSEALQQQVSVDVSTQQDDGRSRGQRNLYEEMEDL